MVNVTVKTEFDGERKVHTLPPCDITFITQMHKAEEGRYLVTSGVLGRLDIEDIEESAASLADSTVNLLTDVGNRSRDTETAILVAYMKSFVELAVDKLGTETMDKVLEMLSED